MGTVKTKNIKIPAWLFLSITLFLSSLLVTSCDSSQRPTLNGEFEEGTSGWTARNSTLSIVSNGQSGKCLQITATEDAIGYAYATFPTEVDETYKFTAYYKKGTASNGQMKVGTAIDSPDLYYSGVLSDEDWMEYTSVFTANTPETFITLVNLTSIEGETSLFDSVTLVRTRAY